MTYLIRKVSESKPKEITCGILRALIKSEDFNLVDFAYIEVRKETKKHYHKKLTEFYYILNGSLKIELDGKIENCDAGTIIMIKPGTTHKAMGNADLLVACCPPWTEKDEIMVE